MKAVSCMAALLLLVVGPSSAASEDGGGRPSSPSERGPFPVGFTYFTAFDAARKTLSGGDRPVPIFVFYPADPGAVGPGARHARYPRDPFRTLDVSSFSSRLFERQGIDAAYDAPTPSERGRFPLVVFSTGARAPWWYNVGTATRLASHGFVVALLAHYGDGAVHPAPQIFGAGDPRDPLLHVAQRGLDKPKDLSFAIDRLLERSHAPGDLLHGLIHPTRIAAAGHSFGGLAAMMLVAGHERVCDAFPAGVATAPPETCVALAPDRRIRALLLLDGSSQNLKWKELARIDVPTIGIGEDWFSILANFGADSASWQARQHAAIPGPPSDRVDIVGTMHVPSLTNACQLAYLRADAEGFLEEGQLQQVTPVFTAAQRDAELARLGCSATSTPYAEANAIVWRYAVAFLRTNLAHGGAYRCMLTTRWSIEREPYAEFFAHEAKSGDPGVETPDDSWFYKTELDVPPVEEQGGCEWASDEGTDREED